MSKSKASRERAQRKLAQRLAVAERRHTSKPVRFTVTGLVNIGRAVARNFPFYEADISDDALIAMFDVSPRDVGRARRNVGAYKESAFRYYNVLLHTHVDLADPLTVLDSLHQQAEWFCQSEVAAIFRKATPYWLGTLLSDRSRAYGLSPTENKLPLPDSPCLLLWEDKQNTVGAILIDGESLESGVRVYVSVLDTDPVKNCHQWLCTVSFRLLLRERKFRWETADYSVIPAGRISAEDYFSKITSCALILLNSHAGYRYANSSPQSRTAKAAAVDEESDTQPEDASRLRIVYVNKVETIRPQGDEAGEHTSRSPVSPHDRRGSYCTSKLGNRFWRKGAKVKGGAPQPKLNVVKLANPLRPAAGQQAL